MVGFFIGGVVILGACFGLYALWARRISAEIAEGGEVEWAQLQKNDPELVAGLTREQFDAIYRRVNFPRFPKYALACAAAFFLSLPIILALLSGGIWAGEALGLLPAPAEFANRYLVEDGRMRVITAATPEAAMYYARDLAGFYYFFGVLFAWIVIVTIFMRRYHARRPGYLREEILRAR
ncbi:hypothetical protein [Amphiplicatus metriothermophilus]|uniref:Uncharacterized protein n=1 Tax=Amphiplicatus metriothermophilus TaxID=1519374 RepID=A0A239PIR1_9PROT|nr:hypothetical protein [Amphiplicatus metriothermophilus]MBB5517990.1 hypothetical protein [Amphiplicatus metriothermophilus]SNT67676.1 hypothetical protein SAMN06297382_0168 [Amphiplicatus metriothermophilus]